MKTFIKDSNLNQEELNTTINLLKNMKESISTHEHVVEDPEIKNPVKTIISDLLDYTVYNLSKQLKSKNNEIVKNIITDETLLCIKNHRIN